MALTFPFGLTDVRAEFGTTNQPQGLRAAYNRIFGSVTSGVSRLSDFEGYGQPTVTFVSSSGGSTTIDITFSVTRHNLDCNVRIKYDDDLNFSSPSYTTTSTYTTDGNKTIQLSGLTTNTTWYYQIEYWNAFNDQHVDDYATDVVRNEDTLTPTLLAPDLLDTITYDLIDGHTLQWNQSGDEPTDYTIEYNLNGGAWSVPANVTNKTNYGSTTDPKSADVDTGQLPDPGDTFNFRVRGTRAGYNTSPWSNTRSYTH